MIPTTLPFWSAIVLAFAGIGLYEGLRFLGFYQLRRDPRLLHTGLLSAIAGLYALTMVFIYAQPSVDAAHAWTRWRYGVSAFLPFAFVGAGEALLGQPTTYVRRLSLLVGVVVFGFILLVPEWVYGANVRIREVALLRQTFFDFPARVVGKVLFAWSTFIGLYLIWLIIRSVSRRDFFSFSAFALLLFGVFGFLDVLTVIGVTNLPYFLEFGCVFVVMATNRALLQEYFDLLNEKEKLVNMRSRLLANISHELRTPLGAALGYLQLLQRKKDLPGNTAEMIDKAHASLQDESDLIEQLIDISRYAAAEADPAKEEVHIGTMVDDIFERLQLLAQKKEIVLVASGDLDTWAEVDPKWFPLAVKNLVHNALKFSPVGSKVKLQVHLYGTDLVVRVRDRGRGIPLREQQQVFGRFSQGSESKDNDVEAGLGIGLALVRDVATSHGGHIKLSSRVWKGSVFELRIPLHGGKLMEEDVELPDPGEDSTIS